MAPTIAVVHRSRGSRPRRHSARAVALALDGVFFLFVAFFVVAAVAFGQRGAEMPTDNWWLFGPVVGAGPAGLSGGVIALVATVRGDRHATLAVPLGLGGLVVLAIVGRPVVVLPVILGGLAWFFVRVRVRVEPMRMLVSGRLTRCIARSGGSSATPTISNSATSR